jgi:hypothetical protein
MNTAVRNLSTRLNSLFLARPLKETPLEGLEFCDVREISPIQLMIVINAACVITPRLSQGCPGIGC